MNRSRFQGVRTVVRFNWPIYVAAVAVLAVTATVAALPFPGLFRMAGTLAAAGALWFLLGSLGATHWVYDRSDLYRWNWLRSLCPSGPFRLLVCHTGFDEVSAGLRATFPEARIEVLDHFDAGTMTEASIRRARALHPPPPATLAAPFDRWPDIKADLILAPLAVHELRSVGERAAWFAEARRSLEPGGTIVVVEHLRDLPNFLAFGPGFVHFHTAAAWRRSWQQAGLGLERSFSLTPFLRVFVLK
ncbi:methyltransferase [Haloferula sp. A504]|uniref:methyltransferase n=1 Tax=Haloferula sp. A504 TaxID=3373601 RepID=UPI0031CB9510|nr:class I SAM-dependent methyltransferase [Verrucomicrobiaceae bacterium E54]